MNLYNIWVSLSEMSDKNIGLFSDIQFFLDVPVLENILVSNNELKNVFSHVHTKLGLISSQIKV